jgi:hypothetical protein
MQKMRRLSRELYTDPEDRFETAQVCLNGHTITSSFETQPELHKKFCDTCGSETITQCQNCDEKIQGSHSEAFYVGYTPPSFCHNCGKPFPWTEKRLEAARELTMMAEELANDQEKLLNSLSDLMTDTPRTQVAALHWRRALSKLGSGTAEAMKQILISIVTEAAKQTLFPR